MRLQLSGAKSGVEYNETVSEWHKTVREYVRILGKDLHETTATLFEEARPQVQEHLRKRPEELGTDCRKVIVAVEILPSFGNVARTVDPRDTRDPPDAIGNEGTGKGIPDGKIDDGSRARAKEQAMSMERKATAEKVTMLAKTPTGLSMPRVCGKPARVASCSGSQ